MGIVGITDTTGPTDSTGTTGPTDITDTTGPTRRPFRFHPTARTTIFRTALGARADFDEVDPPSPAGLTRGSIFLAREWAIGPIPARWTNVDGTRSAPPMLAARRERPHARRAIPVPHDALPVIPPAGGG